MNAVLDLVTELLQTFLPDPWDSYAKIGLLTFTLAVALYLIGRRFVFRTAVYIRPLNVGAALELADGGRLAGQLADGVARIQQIHSEQALTGAAYGSSLSQLRPVNEDLGHNFDTRLATIPTLSPLAALALRASEWLWPRIELQGDLGAADGNVVYSGRLVRGSTRRSIIISVPDQTYAHTRLMRRLAFEVVLALSDGRFVTRGALSGTKNWQALKAHTDALERWQDPIFDANSPAQVQPVDALLEESLRHDPGYAMVHYNRGTLAYLSHHGAQQNAAARHHFEAAIGAIEAERDGRLPRDPTDRRIAGLAWAGVARCYAQDRQRYGKKSAEIIERARAAGERARRLLGDDIKALQALALSWHCTDTLEDIRIARPIYERIVRKEPRTNALAHNNLGFILMMGGQHLAATGNRHEAVEWYRAAERHMKTVIEIARPSTRLIDFAHANLGNLYRLQRDYEQAISHYLRAVRGDPEHSSYTNGLNELARVYLETGKTAAALHCHALALRSTTDRDHQRKLMGQVHECLAEIGHPAAAHVAALLAEVGDAVMVREDAGPRWHAALGALLITGKGREATAALPAATTGAEGQTEPAGCLAGLVPRMLDVVPASGG